MFKKCFSTIINIFNKYFNIIKKEINSIVKYLFTKDNFIKFILFVIVYITLYKFYIKPNLLYIFIKYCILKHKIKIMLFFSFKSFILFLYTLHLNLPKILYVFCIIYHIELMENLVFCEIDPVIELLVISLIILLYFSYESVKAQEYGFKNLIDYYTKSNKKNDIIKYIM